MNGIQEVKVNAVRNVANVCLASCQKLVVQIEQAKNRLAAEFKDNFKVQEELFRLALTEAEALAWQTEYPQLFFPALAREKVQAVAAWQTRQDSLRRRGARFAGAA
jgi:predicted secreted hydrolase